MEVEKTINLLRFIHAAQKCLGVCDKGRLLPTQYEKGCNNIVVKVVHQRALTIVARRLVESSDQLRGHGQTGGIESEAARILHQAETKINLHDLGVFF